MKNVPVVWTKSNLLKQEEAGEELWLEGMLLWLPASKASLRVLNFPSLSFGPSQDPAPQFQMAQISQPSLTAVFSKRVKTAGDGTYSSTHGQNTVRVIAEQSLPLLSLSANTHVTMPRTAAHYYSLHF